MALALIAAVNWTSVFGALKRNVHRPLESVTEVVVLKFPKLVAIVTETLATGVELLKTVTSTTPVSVDVTVSELVLI